VTGSNDGASERARPAADRGRPAAAILTGGRAVRMGGARKASLIVGGVRIIDRQVAVLRQVAHPVFLVTSATSPADADLTIVRDRYPGCGALGGIYTAIVDSPRERTFVVACDLPFLSAPLLEHMQSIEADLVIPRTARGYEPLCALYARACAEPIRIRLERGDFVASVLPEGMRVAEIGPEALAMYDPDGLLCVNVNTPHDYERARELGEGNVKTSRDRIMDDLDS
jgi:molybdopterin-guanine dinucleotide biosynthesis protein A